MAKVPLLPLIVPVPEIASVVVAVPEPTLKVPEFSKAPSNRMLPDDEPMLPELPTALKKSKVPVVEVTVPANMVVLLTTVRA